MLNKMINHDSFKDISFPRKEAPENSAYKYRVYTDNKNYTLVEAPNAQEALKISGVQNPVRVLRHLMSLQNIMMLKETSTARNEGQEPPAAPENTAGGADQSTASPAATDAGSATA